MTRLPRLTGEEILSTLQKFGFSIIRVKGSHHFLRHSDGRCTTVIVHSGEIIGPRLFKMILRDTELLPEDFQK